jgi:hypothetical protein
MFPRQVVSNHTDTCRSRLENQHLSGISNMNLQQSILILEDTHFRVGQNWLQANDGARVLLDALCFGNGCPI